MTSTNLNYSDIKKLVKLIKEDNILKTKHKINEILFKKEQPYLKEIEENKGQITQYTANDIIDLIHSIFREINPDLYKTKKENKSIENQDFTCTKCKKIISLESYSNLTKNDFNYCPYCRCRKPFEN